MIRLVPSRKARRWKDHQTRRVLSSTATRLWKEAERCSGHRCTKRVRSLTPPTMSLKSSRFKREITQKRISSFLPFLELKQLSSSQLTELFGEMESLVAALSETLIAELALRDELEYEKELKNQFISLLLAVQNRRRQHHVTKKRSQMQSGTSPLPQHRSLQEPKVKDSTAIIALSREIAIARVSSRRGI